MIENILAWVFLFIGIFTLNPIYFVASGVFAIATQLDSLRKGNNNNGT